MSAPAEPVGDGRDPFRTHPDAGPRTIAELRVALSAASAEDREQFEAELGALVLGDTEAFEALVRGWRHRLAMRTRPELLAAIAASSDAGARRWTSAEILGAGR